MKKYTYNDWYSGKVRLNTCSSGFPEGMQPISEVYLNEFNVSDIAKIQNKQKEIFEKEKDFYLKRFIDQFNSRLRNSKQKLAYLKLEHLKCRSILTGNDDIDLDEYREFVGLNLLYFGRDLYMYREYYKNVVVNGQERDYRSINSPNFLYQSEDIKPREIFAQAMIEYLDFLNKLISNQTKKADQKKREKESYEKIFNSSFDFCKSFEDFLQLLQINELTLKPNELLIKLNEYKTYYSKAVAHFEKFNKDESEGKMYQNVLKKIDEQLASILESKNKPTTSKITFDNKNLKDIWLANTGGTKDEYEIVIDLLLKENVAIGVTFLVKETVDKYVWQKLPLHCWVKYLAGFVFTCMKNKWISKGISAPDFKKILLRTFNIEDFDHKPFKSLHANPPADKYLIPFKGIPINK